MSNRLRLMREHNGFSIRDVQQGTGLSVGYLSELERGIKRDVSLSVARVLVGFFQTDIDYLFPDVHDDLGAAKRIDRERRLALEEGHAHGRKA